MKRILAGQGRFVVADIAMTVVASTATRPITAPIAILAMVVVARAVMRPMMTVMAVLVSPTSWMPSAPTVLPSSSQVTILAVVIPALVGVWWIWLALERRRRVL